MTTDNPAPTDADTTDHGPPDVGADRGPLTDQDGDAAMAAAQRDALGERTEAEEREALRARMRGGGQQPEPEQFIRDAHRATKDRLAELRATRDQYNDRIREAVAEEKVLAQAVAVFERAARDRSASQPGPTNQEAETT